MLTTVFALFNFLQYGTTAQVARQLWDDLEQARAHEQLIDTFGVTRAGDTPFLVWQLRTRGKLLDAAAREALKSRSALKERCRVAQEEQTRLKAELAGVEQAQRAAGGDTIERLKAEIEAAQTARDRARKWRSHFVTNTAELGLDPVTAVDFATVQADAETFLAELPGRLNALATEQQNLRKEGWPAQDRREDLIAERDSLDGRTGRVPRRMHAARLAIATAAFARASASDDA